MTEHRAILVAFALGVSLSALIACNRKGEVEEAATSVESADLLVVSVDLAPDEQGRLGLSIAPLVAAEFQETVEGQATVLDAQPVVELMANRTAAAAALDQSRAARERASALFDADAAGSRQVLEAAQRQAAADAAALEVAEARATFAYGNAAPWLEASRRARSMQELRDGDAVIVRATFPGRRLGEVPAELTLRPLGSGGDQVQRTVTDPWFGPADPNVPGSVLLAYVSPAGGLVAGARLRAMLATGETRAGVVVPRSAVVIAGGSGWCYRALGDNAFLRTSVALDRPIADGYFQAEGLAPGDAVVVTGAGLLLAHELAGVEGED